MAISDARPIPRYGEPYRVYIPLFYETGDITHSDTVSSVVSKDTGEFIFTVNEPTPIHNSGFFYIDLTEEEMEAHAVIVKLVPEDNDFKSTPIILYPEAAGDMRAHVLTVEEQTILALAHAVMDDAVPGTHGVGTAGNVLGSFLASLPTSMVIVSPIVDGGNLFFVRGDDYLAEDGRNFLWVDNGNRWPDLSTATVHLVIGSARFFKKQIDVLTPSGPTKSISAELTSTETRKFTQPAYTFTVEATMQSGSRITLIKGSVKTTAGL